jgi:hypothetical protein
VLNALNFADRFLLAGKSIQKIKIKVKIQEFEIRAFYIGQIRLLLTGHN